MSDETFRWVMFAVFLTAFPIYTHTAGMIARRTSWPWRLVLLGGGLLLLYVTTGQIKARVYNVPIDALSYFGLGGGLVLIAGMVLALARERRTHGQG